MCMCASVSCVYVCMCVSASFCVYVWMSVSISMFNALARLFKDADEGNYAFVETEPGQVQGSVHYRRSVFAFGASLRLLLANGCKPVLAADGTFCKQPVSFEATVGILSPRVRHSGQRACGMSAH